MKEIPLGITFDDVLLIPQKSDITPSEVDLTAPLTKNITLKHPLASAAMDTVTNAPMAIALAQEGGIGFLHRNCSIQEQVKMLTDVKKKDKTLLVGAAIGPHDIDRAKALDNAGADVISIDCAHAHKTKIIQDAKKIKHAIKADLIVGNIATSQAALAFAHIADALKVGVGPGSICFEAGTLITMADYSARPIENVALGEFVITHKNRKRMVSKKYVRKHKGTMCVINVNGCPDELNVTPNHPILAVVFGADAKKVAKYGAKYYFDKKKYNERGLIWVEAGALRKGDVVAIPRSEGKCDEEKVFDLAQFVPNAFCDNWHIWSEKIGFNPNKESHVQLAVRFGTTPRIIQNIVHGGRSLNMTLNGMVNRYLEVVEYQREIEPNKIQRFIRLDRNLMRLFGYFVSEGYIAGSKNNRQLCFAFSRSERAYHEEVIRLVDEVFGYASSKVIEHKTKNSAVVHVFSHAIATFFEGIFSLGARNKCVPAFLLGQDSVLLRDFVRCAWNGDGSIKEYGRASYKTVSPSLAFQMAEALIRLGFMPSVRSEKIKNPAWSTQYKVSVSGFQHSEFMKLVFPELATEGPSGRKQQIWSDEKYIYATVKSARVVEKETLVYNLEVEKDNSYLANRIAVHNCTTRIVSGVGVPQLTAIMNVSKAVKSKGIPVIADGGIRFSGDIVKALAAGASTVMLGSLFSGTDEAPGKIITLQGKKYKAYRGMGSFGAMEKGKATDRYSQKGSEKHVAEGIEALTKYKGSLHEIVFQLLGGIRSGMGYTGAKNIDQLHTKAQFIRITQAGRIESHPHSVIIQDVASSDKIF